MSKFWRIVFAMLLAVALPIQGVAAQTMLLCGASHHQTAAVHDLASHEGSTVAQGTAIGDGAAASEANDANDANHANDAELADAKHAGKCSVCSSCCNAAGMTSAVVSINLISAAMPAVATVPVANDRVLIGGLDRPPRVFRD